MVKKQNVHSVSCYHVFWKTEAAESHDDMWAELISSCNVVHSVEVLQHVVVLVSSQCDDFSSLVRLKSQIVSRLKARTEEFKTTSLHWLAYTANQTI